MQLKRADRREVYTLFWSILFTLCFDLFCLYSVWLFCFRQDKESWTLGSRKDTSFKYKHKYVTCEHKTVMHPDKNNKYKQLCTRQLASILISLSHWTSEIGWGWGFRLCSSWVGRVQHHRFGFSLCVFFFLINVFL